jgi:hypothetical protein
MKLAVSQIEHETAIHLRIELEVEGIECRQWVVRSRISGSTWRKVRGDGISISGGLSNDLVLLV